MSAHWLVATHTDTPMVMANRTSVAMTSSAIVRHPTLASTSFGRIPPWTCALSTVPSIHNGVSFAMAGKGTRSPQLFFHFGDNSRLDGMGFAPFGKGVEGMDGVEAIEKGGSQGGETSKKVVIAACGELALDGTEKPGSWPAADA